MISTDRGLAGDLSAKNLVVRRDSYASSKNASADTQINNSFYVYDEAAGTSAEVCRLAFAENVAGTFGTMSIGTLHTDDGGSGVLEPTLQVSSTQTKISCVESTEVAAPSGSLFVDSSGLSFDSDRGALYFGAGREFRFKYYPANGSTVAKLSLEALVGASYVSKVDVFKS